MNFEAPLTSLVWITSIVSIAMTYVISVLIIPMLGGDSDAMVETCDDHLLRNAGGRDHSRTGEGLYFHGIAARARSGDLGRRRRRVAGHLVRLRGRQFLRLLPRAGDGGADVHRLPGQLSRASAT